MTPPTPTAADIVAIRQRLSQFSRLTTPPHLSAAVAAQVRDDIRSFNEWSDYQTLGICADTLAAGHQALELFLAALGVAVSLDLPAREGPIYLKFNTLKGAWYLDDYSGMSRGVLITFHTSEPELAELAGTYGPFSFDLFADPPTYPSTLPTSPPIPTRGCAPGPMQSESPGEYPGSPAPE